jgi:hypothetical protein
LPVFTGNAYAPPVLGAAGLGDTFGDAFADTVADGAAEGLADGLADGLGAAAPEEAGAGCGVAIQEGSADGLPPHPATSRSAAVTTAAERPRTPDIGPS